MKTAAVCIVAAASSLLAGPVVTVEAPAGNPLAKSLVIWGEYYSETPANLGSVKAYSAALHNLALKSDGTVAAWGSINIYGELNVPFGLSNVTAVAAGGNHSLALTADGTVAAWGKNSEGQCDIPSGLTTEWNFATAIAAGGSHSIALQDSGWVYAWGKNSDGQCDVPYDLENVVAIAAGNSHNLALKADNTVAAWGSNLAGESTVPEGLTDVIAISAGFQHSVALKSDGTVVAWGANNWGQTTVPEGLTNIVKIAAARNYTLALRADGKVFTWGENSNGMMTVPSTLLGVTDIVAGYQYAFAQSTPSVAMDDKSVGASTDAKVFTIRNTGNATLTISEITLGGLNNTDFTLDVANTATTLAAGATTTFTVVFTPSEVGPRTAEVKIDSDALDYSIALGGNGLSAGVPQIAVTDTLDNLFPSVVSVWGDNTGGQTNIPAGLTNVVALSGRWEHMLALRSDGTVVAWGNNSEGQTDVPDTLNAVIGIAVGKGHSVVLQADGTVVAWGRNSSGQCNVPANLTDVVSIGAGDDYTVALKSDGTVTAWGYGGDGVTSIPGTLGEVKQIAAGSRHIVALQTDGTVANWGYGYWGQLVIPTNLSNVKTVGAGHSHSVAVKEDGTVVVWGNNYWHQQDIPAGLTGVVALAGGDDHTLALTANGEVAAWGEAKFGALKVPAEVSGAFGIAAGKYNGAAVYRSTFVGEIPVKETVSKTFKIKNTGGDTLNVGSLSISGKHAGEFVVDASESDLELEPGEETTFKVAFTPVQGGIRKALLHVGSNSPGQEEITVGLTGEGFGTSNARLASLQSSLSYNPVFSPTVTRYTSLAAFEKTSVNFTPTASSENAIIKVNGVVVPSGETSAEIPLLVGQNTITIALTASDGQTNRTYSVVVNRIAPSNLIAPVVTTTGATEIEERSATIQGTVNAKGSLRSVYFDYGLSKTYDYTVEANPATLDSSDVTNVSAELTNLRPHTEYHYRVRVVGDYGSASGVDKTFITPNTAPVAANDALTIIQSVSNLNVLANDSDADGDKATFSVTAITAQLPAAAGKLALAKGVITFTASKSFLEGKANGSSFSYRMTDGFGGTSTASVTLSYSSESIVLEPSVVSFHEAGGTEFVSVTSSGAFSVTGLPTWLKANNPSNTTVELIATPNTAKLSRTATIKIGNATLTVNQNAPSAVPVLGPMPSGDSDIEALIGAKFSLEVPTVGFPVKYTVTGLPKGLALNQTTGFITGVPTVAGSSKVTIAASNSVGAATAKLTFNIVVKPLAEGVVGTFHGMIDRNSELNQILGSRIEVTTTVAGGYSGKIVTGTVATPLKGLVFTDPENANAAWIELPLPTLKATLKLEIKCNGITGTLGGDSGNTAEVIAWRNAWAAVEDKAVSVAGTYTFPILAEKDPENTFPQGIGYGTLAVDAKTGNVKIGGKLADGSVLSGTTFVGPEGEVLIYVPLYTNRGSIFGKVTITTGADAPADNEVSGTVDWYKPAPAGKTADTLYAKGFGPISVEASGGIRKAPAAGTLVLGLSAGENNAVVEFSGDGLEFMESLTVSNPKSTGLTNLVKVNIPVNATKFTKFDVVTGVFEGEFTVEGRKAKFYGQMGPTADGELGIGYFIIRRVPGNGETALTAPQVSGQVVIHAPPQ